MVFESGQATIGEVDDPVPHHRQLLVEVRVAGLNGADIAQAKGGYPPPPGAPTTGGLELAGEVVATGPGCQRFSMGDRVMAVAAGAEVSLNLALLMVKRARLFASTLRPRTLEQRAAVARRMERHVLPLVDAARVRVPIGRTFPLAEATAAYEHFAVPGKLGKVVLIA